MPAQGAAIPPPHSMQHPLSRLLRHARSHRPTIIKASVFSILNKLFDLAPPLLIGMAVDTVVQRQGSMVAQWGIPNLSHQLYFIAALTFVIWSCESLFQYMHAITWRNLAQRIQHELRIECYAHVQMLDLSYFEDRSTGELMAILNDDINQLERFLDNGANEILQVSTTIITIGVIFFALEPTVAAFAFAPMPFVLWGSFAYQKRLAPRYAQVRKHVGSLNSLLSGNLSGIQTIKSFTAEQRETVRVTEESDQYRLSNAHAIRLSSAFSPLIRIVILTGFTMTLILGGQAALDGTLAVGAFSVMVFMTQRLLWPLTGLGQTFDLYQRAMASTARALDLIDTPYKVRSGEKKLNLEQVRGELEFADVTFSYGNRQPVLTNFSLKAPAGHTIALVGATGSGKSTIAKLLLRFYEAQKGKITLDGIPLSDIRIDHLRGAIGFVSQDVYLFHGSVRENIAYGRSDANDAEIERAAKAAEAHEFIESLPEGYETIVGERGQKLSGGQRQRLSIARAVLKNPPILILDEATAAVDNETEAAIQRSLATITQGRTTVIIAHRLSTIRHAHEITVVKEGRVEERGTHDQLVAKGGAYQQLWQVQTGE